MAARRNPGGGKGQEKLWRNALLRALKRRGEGKGSPQWLEVVADRCVADAAGGNTAAQKEIGDRLDGRAVQAVDIEVTVPITKIERVIVEFQREA